MSVLWFPGRSWRKGTIATPRPTKHPSLRANWYRPTRVSLFTQGAVYRASEKYFIPFSRIRA